MAVAPRFLDILERLARHEVELIVVGGVAAILEGAPVSTLDLDIVFNPTDENRRRLLEALRDLNARYLDPAGRHLVPDENRLSTFRLHQLLTDFGPLDVLRTIGAGMTFSDLIDHTREYKVGDLRVRTLGLEMIILSKEQAGRDKDRAALPVLRRTLDLKGRTE
jgi:hypothetical protein